MTATVAMLHYYRCRECLSVMSSAEYLSQARCSCDGRIEHMGRVAPTSRLLDSRYEVPCDGRCTGAIGPSCDCRCKGENHGTGRVVEIIRDAGPVPKLRAPHPERAIEFRAGLAHMDAAFDRRWPGVRERIEHGDRVGEAAYFTARDHYGERSRIRKLRTHGGRMKAIAAYLATMDRPDPRLDPNAKEVR